MPSRYTLLSHLDRHQFDNRAGSLSHTHEQGGVPLSALFLQATCTGGLLGQGSLQRHISEETSGATAQHQAKENWQPVAKAENDSWWFTISDLFFQDFCKQNNTIWCLWAPKPAFTLTSGNYLSSIFAWIKYILLSITNLRQSHLAQPYKNSCHEQNQCFAHLITRPVETQA